MADDIVGKLIFQVDADTKKAEKGINDFNDSMKESQEVAKDTEKSFDDSANKISAKGVAIALAVGTAVAKMANEGRIGAITAFDIPLGYLSDKSPEELRKNLL